MPNPFGVKSNDQVSFLECDKKERWVLGGNRSGKTEIGVVDCILFATGEHPIWSKKWKPPVKIRYCAPSYEDGIKAVVLRKFEDLVKRSDIRGESFEKAWSEKNKTLYFKNGSTVNFKSFEQRRNKFGGADLHAIYSDEHGGKEYYRENKARLADYGGYYVSTMTPEEGSVVWEKRHLKKRANDIGLFKFSGYGNPHLSKEGIEELEKSIDDPRVLRVKMYGDFSALAGLIYEDFDEDIHVIPKRDIPNSWYKVFAIDPHLKKATAMVWGAFSPDNELFIYRCAKEQLTVPDLKKFIRAKSINERINLFIGDEAMGGDGENIFGEKSVLEQLKIGEDAIPVIPTNQSSSKNFEAGISKVRGMLQVEPISKRPSLFIMDDCLGVIDEFEEYQFIPDTKADEMTFRERVRKVDDDYMDCIRYIAMANNPNSNNIEITSAIGEDW